jgi:hypothetical protein
MMDPNAPRKFIRLTLHQELAGYVAITDTFGAIMTPELLEVFPDAKVICTVRDPETWWPSWKAATAYNIPDVVKKIILWPVPTFRYVPYTIDMLWRR